MPSLIQPSFAKGEIGPHLYGRVDTAAYQVALKSARNCIIHPWGGASNRPGTRFIAPQKVHTYSERLIDFQFKTTDSYVLCFGHQYLRFIRNDTLIAEAAKTITNITQANPAVVTATAHGYSDGQEVFIVDVVGMTQVNGRWFKVDVLTANTFALYDQETGLVPVNSVGYTAYASGGAAARVYEIATPYTSADLNNIKYTQSHDVMTLTHPSYPTRELSRLGHTSWTLIELSTGAPWSIPFNLACVASPTGAVTYQYTITAINQFTGEESLPGLDTSPTGTIASATNANPAVFTRNAHGFSNGDLILLQSFTAGWTSLNVRYYTANNVTANTFELIDADGNSVDSTTFGAFSAGIAYPAFTKITNGAVTASNTISWNALTNAERYYIYKFDNGVYGFIGETKATSFRDDNIQANLARTPPTRREPFNAVGEYPQAVGYFEQRRLFGGSNDAPDQTDFSTVGLHSNFNRSSPLQEDDAFTTVLSAGQVNEIRHYVSLNDLLTFTSGAEFKTNSGNDTAFSANSVKQKAQSSWGCSHLRPQVVGNTVIFAEDSKARVRSMGFSFQIDGYAGVELSLLAPHLLETSPIYDWAFSNAPEPRLYMAREDGRAMAMTFDQEQEVVGWTPWDTKGSYERFCVLRNPSVEASRENGVYIVVKRRINGKTVRYIEKQASRTFQDIRDAYFVDCGLSIDNPINIENIQASGGGTLVTSTAHGLTDGTEIELSDIVWEPDVDEMFNENQPDQLNYSRFFVADATANTFTLEDEDGNPVDFAGLGYFDYVSGGTIRQTFITVSGYDHLEGMEVSCLLDGDVVSGMTITNGGLTLPRRAARVHIGLRYISDIETLNVEASSGTIQDKFKNMVGAVFRFKQTRGVLMGPSTDQLEEWNQREFEPYGAPTDQFSGLHEQVFAPNWSLDGHCFIRQPYPLPVTLLAAVPKFELGG